MEKLEPPQAQENTPFIPFVQSLRPERWHGYTHVLEFATGSLDQLREDVQDYLHELLRGIDGIEKAASADDKDRFHVMLRDGADPNTITRDINNVLSALSHLPK